MKVARDHVLVCFAVPTEAKPFLRQVRNWPIVKVMVTGIGAANAEPAVRNAIAFSRPSRVFTCGFAGALDPSLRIGDIIFETADTALAREIATAGGKPARFHCSSSMAITASDKAGLRAWTKADAVEMESAPIQKACAEAGIPCATLRVISDEANEDLPLDFNVLLDANTKLSLWKMTVAILKAPHVMPALTRLGKNSTMAAGKLAEVLVTLIR